MQRISICVEQFTLIQFISINEHSRLGVKGPPLVGEEVRKKVGTHEVDDMLHNLRRWEDVGLSMAICLTLYPSHELSSYTILIYII